MRKLAFYVLVAVIFAGTLALAGGTRTLTEIKKPIFTAGAMLAGVGALLACCLRGGVFCSRKAALFAATAAAYLGLTALSALWAEHPWTVQYALAEQFPLLLLAVSAAVVVSGRRDWQVVAGAYAILGAVAAVFSLLWHGVLPLVPGVPLGFSLNDIRAPLGNANLLGVFLIMPLGMAAALLFGEWTGGRRKRVVVPLGVALALMLTVFVLCRSLSAWMGLLTWGAVFAVLASRRKGQMTAAVVVIAGVVAVGLWVSGALGAFRQTRTYLLRAEYWRRAGVMALSRPVGGWGAGNFFTDNQPLGERAGMRVVRFTEGGHTRDVPLHEVVGQFHASSPHNEYLHQAAEGGAAGVVLYLVLAGVPLWAAVAAYRKGFEAGGLLTGAISVYAAFLVTNFVTMNMRFADFAPHFWILAGLLVSAGAAKRRGAAERTRGVGVGGRLVAAVVVITAGAYGIYSLAVRDYLSSMDYASGQAAYSRGDTDEAQASFRRAAAQTWNAKVHAWSLRRLGDTYLSSGEAGLAGAHSVLDRLSKMVAGYVDFQLGEVLERGGHFEEALFYYRKHAGYKPWNPRVQVRIQFCEVIASVQEELGNDGLRKAARYFEMYPDDIRGRRIYLRTLIEKSPASLDEIKKTAEFIQGPASTPGDWFLVGRVKLLAGDAEGAVELMEKAKAAGFRGAGINSNRVAAYIELGRLEDAGRALAEGQKVHPDCVSLAELAARLDELERARAAEVE